MHLTWGIQKTFRCLKEYTKDQTRPELERKFMLMFTIEAPMLFFLSCELGSLHEVKSVQLAFAFTYFICSCYVYAHTV